MTPERASGLVQGWVRLYTRDLAGPVAERRLREIGSDLHEHIAYERARGTSDLRIALGILSRMARGVTDDVAWRRRAQPLRGVSVKPFVAVLIAAIAVAALALVLDSPVLILISVAMIVANGIALFAIGVRAAQERDILLPFVATIAGAMAVAALAVGAIVVGERGDAPGLVLFGVVVISCVIVGAFSLGARTAQRGR